MAGAGYRTWTAGEVVTATNVQTYLQDQTVGVYAGTAARSSAILSPSEGQVSYRTDDDIVEVYDGSGWVPVSAPSDSGLVHINTTSFSAVASVSINDVFSATYKNYLIKITGTIASGNDLTIRFRVGGVDATTNYNTQQLLVSGATLTGARLTGQTSAVFANWDTTFNGYELYIYNPFTSVQTQFRSISTNSNNTISINERAGRHATNASYDGFTIASGSNITGDIYVYGFKE